MAEGALIIDKPVGPTSHDVVARVKRTVQSRVGHTGTLDPLASGVLPLLLGRATRLASFYQSSEKEYLAEVRLGSATSTYDAEGEVTQRQPVPEFTIQEVEDLLQQFRGEQQQLPPMFSAVRIRGRRLYELARRGQELERPARSIHVRDLELLERGQDSWRLRIVCSAGTYIRSLAHDLGRAAGCGAHLSGLRRTRSGEFGIEQALPLERLGEEWERFLLSPETLLTGFARVDLSEEQARRVGHGNSIPVTPPLAESDYCRLFHGPTLLAIGQVKGAAIQPTVVFTA